MIKSIIGIASIIAGSLTIYGFAVRKTNDPELTSTASIVEGVQDGQDNNYPVSEEAGEGHVGAQEEDNQDLEEEEEEED